MSTKIEKNVLSGAPLHLPPLKGGLGCLIFEACEKFADRICHISPIADGDVDELRCETFASFKDRTARVAQELLRRGLRPRDVIVNCCANHCDNSLTTAASLYIGVVPSTLDPTLSERDCARLLALMAPKIIFVDEKSLELIKNGLKTSELQDRPAIVVHRTGGNTNNNIQPLAEGYEDFEVFLKHCADAFQPIPEVDPSETAIVLFSSGSTGLSKGVCVSHMSLMIGALGFRDVFDDTSCMMHSSTFYWISATLLFIASFLTGGTRIAAQRFEPEYICKLIEQHKIAAMFIASSSAYTCEALSNLRSRYNLSSLKTILFGGGPMSVELMYKVRALFPGVNINLCYGMTEIAACATGFDSHARQDFLHYPSSCGRPMPGLLLKVVNPETEEALGPDEAGEIRLKPHAPLNGYYRLPEETADMWDTQGYFKTGDLGCYNPDGFVYVNDRLKDMFKYKSWHIVPAAIEAVIKEHAAVVESVVFGVPNEEVEALPAAAVVLKQNVIVSEEEIARFVAERVVDRQQLRGGVYFVEDIAKTPSGKIQRKKTRDIMLALITEK